MKKKIGTVSNLESENSRLLLRVCMIADRQLRVVPLPPQQPRSKSQYIQLTSPSVFDILFVLHEQLEKLRKRAFDLVSNAYTSIRAEDLARLMGVKTDVAVSGE